MLLRHCWWYGRGFSQIRCKCLLVDASSIISSTINAYIRRNSILSYHEICRHLASKRVYYLQRVAADINRLLPKIDADLRQTHNCGACGRAPKTLAWSRTCSHLATFKMRLRVNSTRRQREVHADNLRGRGWTRSPAYWRQCFVGDKWKDSEQFTIISMKARCRSTDHRPAKVAGGRHAAALSLPQAGGQPASRWRPVDPLHDRVTSVPPGHLGSSVWSRRWTLWYVSENCAEIIFTLCNDETEYEGALELLEFFSKMCVLMHFNDL